MRKNTTFYLIKNISSNNFFFNNIYILLLFFFIFLPDLSYAAKVKWAQNGHEYELIISGLISWDQANSIAVSKGGYLVTITSAAENSFIVGSFGSSIIGAWLGGYQLPGSLEPRGGWTWVNGEGWGYSNWAGGQPDNNRNEVASGENVLNYWAVGSLGQWNDYHSSPGTWYGTASDRFIVEYPAPKPQIKSVKAKYKGYFHEKIPFSNDVEIKVDWKNATPKEVRFRLKRDHNITFSSVTATGDTVTKTFDMGNDFVSSITALGRLDRNYNTVEIIAVNSDNIESEPYNFTETESVPIYYCFYNAPRYGPKGCWEMTYEYIKFPEINLGDIDISLFGDIVSLKYKFLLEGLTINANIKSSGKGSFNSTNGGSINCLLGIKLINELNKTSVTATTPVLINNDLILFSKKGIALNVSPLTIRWSNLNPDINFIFPLGVIIDKFKKKIGELINKEQEPILKWMLAKIEKNITADLKAEFKIKDTFTLYRNFKEAYYLNQYNKYSYSLVSEPLEMDGSRNANIDIIGNLKFCNYKEFSCECGYYNSDNSHRTFNGNASDDYSTNVQDYFYLKILRDGIPYKEFRVGIPFLNSLNSIALQQVNGAQSTQQENSFMMNSSYSSPFQMNNGSISVANDIISNNYLSLENFNGKTIICYVSSDPLKNKWQSSDISYYFYAGGTGINGSIADNNSHSEFSPELSSDNSGNIICVWRKVKADNYIPDNLGDFLNQFEIFYSSYNIITNVWTSPVPITNNEHYDSNPKMRKSHNGKIMLIWEANENNISFSDNDSPSKIYFEIWNGSAWSSPNILLNNISSIRDYDFAYNDNEGIFVFSKDMDNDSETINDSEIFYCTYDGMNWSSPIRLINDDTFDKSVTVFYNTNRSLEIYWIKNGELVKVSDLSNGTYSKVFQDVAYQNISLLDYKIINDQNDNIALIYKDIVDNQFDIFYIYFSSEKNSWCLPQRITNDYEREINFSSKFDSEGNIIVAYNREISNDPNQTESNLYYFKKVIGNDLSIENLIFSEDNPADNQEITINAVVKNIGSININSYKVSFYNGDPDNNGELIEELNFDNEGLIAGSNKSVNVHWTPAFDSNPLYVYALVEWENETSEISLENNKIYKRLYYPDIAIDNCDYEIDNEGKILITASIHNNGRLPISSFNLKLENKSENNALLYTSSIENLESGSTYEFEYLWDLSNTIIGTDIYTICLVSDETNEVVESDESNNSATIYVLVDTDRDHISDWWEDKYGLDKDNEGDADIDSDNDGLSNISEYLHHTNPSLADTDNDGMNDGWEVNNSLNPLLNDTDLDPDNDGLNNGQEEQYKTDPNKADTDADGMSDGNEIKAGMEPDNAESLFKMIHCGFDSGISGVTLKWRGSISNPDLPYMIFWRDDILLPWNEVITDYDDIHDNDGIRTWIDEGDNNATIPRSVPEKSKSRFYKVIVE